MNSDQDVREALGAFRPRVHYDLTANIVVRAIGFIHFVAFGSLFVQVLPLLGSEGLLPIAHFLEWVAEATGGQVRGFVELPTLFWISSADWLLQGVAFLGVLLSLLAMLGRANVLVLGSLWFLYLSFVHVGQTFYGYGWEYLLLEATVLCCFLTPVVKGQVRSEWALWLTMVLFRWLVFRLMFGAGMIKIRGDECWTDLTCLVTHYETQPNPHPLSWLIHQAPVWFHKGGVLFNHLVELIAPFFVFGPRRARLVAGISIVVFQIGLILSGNLSFLNWLSIAVTLACFDDEAFYGAARWAQRVTGWPLAVAPPKAQTESTPSTFQKGITPRLGITIAWCVVVVFLSLDPLANLLQPRQRMNASYNRLHLVNSYGAFGTIHRVRHEVILEGTRDELGPNARWQAYEFPCKPGDPARAPCLVTPYHHRLQWQMWFASFGSPETEPWLPHLVYKLLVGSESIRPLLEDDPFSDSPPKYVRARVFEYRFTTFGEKGWWKRAPAGMWLRPLALDDPELADFLRVRGLLR